VPPFLRSPAAAFLLLPLTALCWAGNHVVARAVGGHVPAASMNAVRWTIVTLVLLPLAWGYLREDWPKLKARPWMMLLFGITGGGAFGTLQYVALQYTTALNMGVVGSVAPAFIVAASWLLFRERLAPLQLAGVLVSLSGVLAIVTRLDPSRLAGLSFNRGDLIILANMACWAIYASCLRARPAVHAATFMLAVAVISALSNLPFAAVEHAYGYHLQATWLTLMATLYAALITTLLAYAAWNRAVDIIGAPRASAFLHTIPLFSALLATTLLGEQIEAFHILAFALILGGVTLVARQPEGAGSGQELPAAESGKVGPKR
jgi:drug/metabolite transporter (DMT)-like permease